MLLVEVTDIIMALSPQKTTCLILCSISLFHSSYEIIDSAYLTPNQPSNNGAYINNHGVGIDVNQNWVLPSTDIEGYHLHIGSNTTFAFSATEMSTIKLEIGSNDTPAPSAELIVSFSQSNNKHITTVLELGARDDHSIFPRCSQTVPYSVARQDVERLVNDRDDDILRAEAAANYNMSKYGNFHPTTIPPIVQFPLIFTLQNYPNDNMLLTYTNPGAQQRNCSYTGFSTHIPFDIYIATEIHQTFKISYFNLSYFEDIPTDSPTTEPTINPSKPPTSPTFPTYTPSKAPTSGPSISPSTQQTTVITSQSPAQSPIISTHDQDTNRGTLSDDHDCVFLYKNIFMIRLHISFCSC